jgi:chemotaxis protein CheY-P-specific phosphatase CheC
LNAISDLLDIQLLPTPPALAIDSSSSILEDVAASAELILNNAVILETEFKNLNSSINGRFLFIPDHEIMEAIN